MLQTIKRHRTRTPTLEDSGLDTQLIHTALANPLAIIRELCRKSLYEFLQYFWPVVSTHKFTPNWHIEYLCSELERIAKQVADKRPREYDLIINVPPGSTKTITCSIMFPAWCWTNWYWMRFITGSYSGALSLESAEYCRELIRSPQFQELFPEIDIKEDKDTKSNFKIVKKEVVSPGRAPKVYPGGSRYSTSVGGTLTGFHGDILIIDDPLNPSQAASDIELANANRWMEQTLSTRKTDKAVTPTILIMQRLHQDDPSGHMLDKQKENIRHVCIPGEIENFAKQVQPPELIEYYTDKLMDPVRLSWTVLKDLEADLGQYGYAGQIGQEPTPPGGGMFRVEHFSIISLYPPRPDFIKTVRYWDKAGTEGGGGSFTVGVRMSCLTNNRWLIEDVRRGRWGTNERERIIKEVAMADGPDVAIWVEQEPGSGGKESAEGTIRNLAGFAVYAERPTGDKIFRADPYSVQVNNGAFLMLNGLWNRDFIEEHRFFPFSTYKDQVDAASGAFNKLVAKKMARRIT
jgi:predicted phage terminase large subunit-like protein